MNLLPFVCYHVSLDQYIQFLFIFLDFQSSVKRSLNNIATLDINSKRSEEVLPLELVIHKHSKFKTQNLELVPTGCTNNSVFYYGDKCDKKKKHKSSTGDIKNSDIVNKLYISELESDNVLLNDNISAELLSYNKITLKSCTLVSSTMYTGCS